MCSPDQKKIYGVARGEMVAVNCSVNAYPGTRSLTHLDLSNVLYDDACATLHDMVYKNRKLNAWKFAISVPIILPPAMA